MTPGARLVAYAERRCAPPTRPRSPPSTAYRVAELTDPANRLRTTHPSGFVGPAFAVRGMLVWGFTGRPARPVLAIAGWEQPWDQSRVEPLPASATARAEVVRR